MSVNSSNSSHSPHPHPSAPRLYNLLLKCFNSTAATVSMTTFTITSILFLLPLCILVLYLGHQRWRQQRSSAAINHSDLFTYHMVISELMNILGSILSCCAVFTDLPEMMMADFYIYIINLLAQIFFHTLTCVERYLAVVHPVIYLGLKKANGIRVRNITIGCIWLLCIAATSLISFKNTMSNIFSFCIIAFALIIICFCSLSVLCVLIRPGPGEGDGGGSRQQVHQSKLRAFKTIMAILGVLLLRFGHNILTTLFTSLEDTMMCVLWLSTPWFSLPSSLVLPLLFLHRAGKLPCCKNNTGSGSE